jgi:hypothetical protein
MAVLKVNHLTGLSPSVRNRSNQHEQDDRGCHPSVKGGREQHKRRNKEEEHDTEPE